MIINIRATNGAGKSTVVRGVMQHWGEENVRKIKSGTKVVDYEVTTPFGPLYVVGRYETPCGGCDGIPTQEEVRARVAKYAKKGHVLFEGIIVTSCYGKYKELFEKLKQPYLFAFLNTPLKTCIKRVEKRRKEKGNEKPFNPKNLEAKFVTNNRVLERCIEDDTPHIVLDYRNAVEEVLCQFEKHPFKKTTK